jgi:hypothetical protein
MPACVRVYICVCVRVGGGGEVICVMGCAEGWEG